MNIRKIEIETEEYAEKVYEKWRGKWEIKEDKQ